MNKIKIATLGLCAAAVVSCGNNTGNGALIGAGSGAVLGAIVGKLAGNTAVEAEADLNNAKVEEVTDVNGLKAVKITFDSGLLFNTSSSELSAASKTNLNNLAKLMKKYSTCAIDAYGHTDNQGWRNSTAEQSAQKNLQLSQQRAESVVNYLKANGVASSQFKNVVGKGSSEPVADNTTQAGMQQNRRVEVFLYASEQMVKEAQQGTLN